MGLVSLLSESIILRSGALVGFCVLALVGPYILALPLVELLFFIPTFAESLIYISALARPYILSLTLI